MDKGDVYKRQGLDTEGHFSSARDVSIMSRELLTNHPKITDYTTIWMDSLRGGATQLLSLIHI